MDDGSQAIVSILPPPTATLQRKSGKAAGKEYNPPFPHNYPSPSGSSYDMERLFQASLVAFTSVLKTTSTGGRWIAGW